jgi:hypothetical protein
LYEPFRSLLDSHIHPTQTPLRFGNPQILSPNRYSIVSDGPRQSPMIDLIVSTIAASHITILQEIAKTTPGFSISQSISKDTTNRNLLRSPTICQHPLGLPECYAFLLNHLLPSGGRILDLFLGYGEFLIGSVTNPSISYTGLDPHLKEPYAPHPSLELAPNSTGLLDGLIQAGFPFEGDERITLTPERDFGEDHSYDLVIVSVEETEDIRKYLKPNGILLTIGATSPSPSLSFRNTFGFVGLENYQGTANAILLQSNTPITLPPPRADTSYLHKIETLGSTVMGELVYKGKHIPHLSQNVWMKLYSASLPPQSIVISSSLETPLRFGAIVPKGGSVFVYVYGSNPDNVEFVYSLEDDRQLRVFHFKTREDAIFHANQQRLPILGIGEPLDTLIATEFRKSFESSTQYEHIEIQSSDDILTRMVAIAFPESNLYLASGMYEPFTIETLVSTRKRESKVLFDHSRKSSLLIQPKYTQILTSPIESLPNLPQSQPETEKEDVTLMSEPASVI